MRFSNEIIRACALTTVFVALLSHFHDPVALLEHPRWAAGHCVQRRGDDLFRSNVVNEDQQPRPQRLDWRQFGGELSLRLGQFLDFTDIDSGQQIIARGKVTVERSRPDLGALGDLVHAGLRAPARENLLRDFENPLTVALSIGSGLAGSFLCG